jgi:hypothetical protein
MKSMEITDFNDLARVQGIGAVREKVLAVINNPPPKVQAKGVVAQDDADAVDAPDAPNIPELIQSFPVPILNEIGEWMEGYSRQAQPQITMQGVLGLASVLCGRNYCSVEANTSSLFLMILGDTGVGKNYVKTGVRKFLNGAGFINLLSGGGNTSSGAVFTALMDAPCHIQITDEIGKQLQTARKQSNGMMAEAFSTLVECYSSTDDMIQPKNYSNMSNVAQGKKTEVNKIRIFCPAITILGLATPKQVYENLTTVEIEDGFLNRLIVVDVTLPQKPRTRTIRAPVPENFSAWAKSVHDPESTSRTDMSGIEMGYGVEPNQTVVDFDEDAAILFDKHLDGLVQREAEGEFVLPDLTRRWNENAMKVATCLAVCANPSDPMVTIEIAEWSLVYIEHYGREFMLNVASKVADSDYHRLCLSVIEQVIKAGSKGLTEHEISRKSRLYASNTPIQRDQALLGLMRDEKMGRVTIKSPSGRGKPREAWVAAEFLTDDMVRTTRK